MIESGKIIVKTKKGDSLECDVLFTFDSDVNNKSYIIYTDNSLDELGNVRVFANTYDKKNIGCLGEIETEEEWKVIEQIFFSIKNEEKSK